ncbi:hypothetical protein Fot_14467 [Forsythia ovata]|uniref:Uncharacterized protein n=1 Tax=Forsythia ovata TaxID=205694 RepID=A0ABD1W6E9_9LAMI
MYESNQDKLDSPKIVVESTLHLPKEHQFDHPKSLMVKEMSHPKNESNHGKAIDVDSSNDTPHTIKLKDLPSLVPRRLTGDAGIGVAFSSPIRVEYNKIWPYSREFGHVLDACFTELFRQSVIGILATGVMVITRADDA